MTSHKKNRSLMTLGPILIILAIIIAPAAIMLLNTLLMVEVVDTESSNVGLFLAHAQELENGGCASCHMQPVVADCSACHASPPTEIDEIFFPHHDPNAGLPYTCELCHGSGDARYAETPNFGHNYCNACHTFGHSRNNN